MDPLSSVRISVVIPSYNSGRTIGQTLDSLESQTRGDYILEVIVVDSSDDEVTKPLLASREHGKILVLHVGQRVPPAPGRNTGARAASGNLLVFIDSDAYMANDWIERIVEARNNGCLVGSGSISLPPFQENVPIAAAQHFLQFNEYMNTGPARAVSFVPSCSLFCDRDLFFKAGEFPNIRASEDVLFCLRAGKLARVWFLPAARVYHIFRQEKKSFLQNQSLLGRYILIYRRLVMGNRFYYKGAWPLLFLPAFTVIKASKIVARVFRAGGPSVKRFITALPLFAAGLLWWAGGFAQAVFEKPPEAKA